MVSFAGCRTGTSFEGPVTWSTFFSDPNGLGDAQNLWGTIRFPDLNGDGKADVCGRHPAGIVCGLSTGTTFEPATLWDDYYTNDGPWDDNPSYWKTIQYADLNGDKKADVCGRAANGMVCRLSTGTSFEPPTAWSPDHFTDIDGWNAAGPNWQTLQLVDINGDGNADVCGRTTAGLLCLQSRGTRFAFPAIWGPAFSNAAGFGGLPQYWATIAYSDLNGDGRADVCGRSATGVVCGLSTP